MQNNNYQAKHPRGSSPAPKEEIQQGFDDCPSDRTEEEFELVVRTGVRGLRSIEQATRELQRGDRRKELTAQDLDTENEARWQDDGGESG
jgi:hypothetical protein